MDLVRKKKKQKSSLSRKVFEEDAEETLETVADQEREVDDKEARMSNSEASSSSDEEESDEADTGGDKSEAAAGAQEGENKDGDQPDTSITRENFQILSKDGTVLVKIREYVPFTFLAMQLLFITFQWVQ